MTNIFSTVLNHLRGGVQLPQRPASEYIPPENACYGPEDCLPDFPDDEIIKFLKSPGSILSRQPQNGRSIYDPTLKSLAVIPIEEAIPEEDRVFMKVRGNEAYLIEHLATGFCYLLHEATYEYWAKRGLPTPMDRLPIFGFDGTKERPSNILYWLTNDLFEQTSPDSLGTRIGGIPLNSNGTSYKGLWPHFEGKPLPFMAQFELADGRYVHVFADANSDHDEYCFSEENSANCAIVEGGEIPYWVDMKSIDEPLLIPAPAYRPNHKYSVPTPPCWLQGDATPDDAGMVYLGQISANMCAEDDNEGNFEYMFGDSGALYVFANPETGRARVTGQCC